MKNIRKIKNIREKLRTLEKIKNIREYEGGKIKNSRGNSEHQGKLRALRKIKKIKKIENMREN